MAKIKRKKIDSSKKSDFEHGSLNELDKEILDFWKKYYYSNCLERRKIVEKLPFDTKADRDLANSFFEDIMFVMQFIKK